MAQERGVGNGRSHWAVELDEDYTAAGAFRGFRLVASVRREDMPTKWKTLHSKDSDSGGRSKNRDFPPLSNRCRRRPPH